MQTIPKETILRSNSLSQEELLCIRLTSDLPPTPSIYGYWSKVLTIQISHIKRVFCHMIKDEMSFQILESCLSLSDIQNMRNTKNLSVKSKIETITSLICGGKKKIRRVYLSHISLLTDQTVRKMENILLNLFNPKV